MAAIPLKIRGLNVVLVVFSLVVLGGAAYYMDMNYQVNLQSGASNVIQNVNGKLVKKGTPAFSPCKNATTNYALVGETTTTSACTPLTVQASLADILVGQRVVATGTFQSGIFYATSLKAETPATPSARSK